MEKVSVIIPTYNRAEFLLQAIGSVLAQSYPVYEVLICDDGSTDSSFERVKALKNPLVQWIDCGRNGRPAIPRNKGIAKAQGDWLAFLDSDDTWAPTKLEQQFQNIKQDKTLAAATNCFKIKAGKNAGPYFEIPSGILTLKELLANNLIICSSSLIHKSLIEKSHGFPEEENMKALEDYGFWLRVASQTSFSYLATPLLNYTDAPETSIRSQASDKENEQKRMVFLNFLSWIKTSGINVDNDIKRTVHYRIARSYGSTTAMIIYKLKMWLCKK